MPKSTQLASLILTTHALRSILDEDEPMPIADIAEAIVVSRISQEVDCNNGFRNQTPLLLNIIYPLFERIGSDIVRDRVYVAENGGRAEHRCRLDGSDERHIRTEDGIASTNPVSHIDELKGFCAIRTSDAVRSSHIAGKVALEPFYMVAPDERSTRQYPRDALIDLILISPVLCFQVYELHQIPSSSRRPPSSASR